MTNDLPRRLFEKNFLASKPIFSLYRKQGHSKISATLLIAAIIVASALTYLLIHSATA